MTFWIQKFNSINMINRTLGSGTYDLLFTNALFLRLSYDDNQTNKLMPKKLTKHLNRHLLT